MSVCEEQNGKNKQFRRAYATRGEKHAKWRTSSSSALEVEDALDFNEGKK